MMQKMVSLTSQNQISIPTLMVGRWGEPRPSKIIMVQVGDEIRLRPVKDFWSTVGSLKSKIHLSDKQLREVRDSFENNWARKI